MGTLYKAKLQSPVGYLASGLEIDSDTAVISGTGILPPAPNLATLGSDTLTEVVRYYDMTETTEAPLQTTIKINPDDRGFGGTTAKKWDALTPISRKYTSYEHDVLVDKANAASRGSSALVAAADASDSYLAAADYLCTDYEDDGLAIAAAITALTPGREATETVKLVGTFNPLSSIAIPSYTKLDMTEATFNWEQEGPLFTATGQFAQESGSDKIYSFTQQIIFKHRLIKPDPAGSFDDLAIDDYMLIYNDDTPDGCLQYSEGEIHQIYSRVYGQVAPLPDIDCLLFSTDLWYTYPEPGSVVSAMKKVEMVKGIHLVGGIIKGPDIEGVNSIAIAFDKVAEFSISNMAIENIHYRAMTFLDCINGQIYGNNIYGCIHDEGNGEVTTTESEPGEYNINGTAILLEGATNALNIHNNISRYCAHHLVLRQGSGNIGSPAWCYYNHNNLHGGLEGVPAIIADTCRSVGFTYTNNDIGGARGDAFWMDCSQWMAEGNNITAEGAAYAFAGNATQVVSIRNCFISKCSYGVYGVGLSNSQLIVIDTLDFRSNELAAVYLDFTDEVDPDSSLVRLVIDGIVSVSGNSEGANDLVYIANANEVSIRNSIVAYAQSSGIRLEDCRSGNILQCLSYNNNQSGTGGSGIVLVDSTMISVQNNNSYDNQITPTQEYGIDVGDDAVLDFSNSISGNIISGNAIAPLYGYRSDSDTMIEGNTGYATEKTGVETLHAADTFVDVTHYLAATPTYIHITAGSAWGNATTAYISNVGATTFRINVNSEPTTGDIIFYWRARIGR